MQKVITLTGRAATLLKNTLHQEQTLLASAWHSYISLHEIGVLRPLLHMTRKSLWK